MFALVHAQASRTTTKTIALRSILASMADLAEQFSFMLRAVCRVQELVAHSTLEAHLVPFQATRHPLFGGVDGLAALGALGVLNRLERHLADRESLA